HDINTRPTTTILATMARKTGRSNKSGPGNGGNTNSVGMQPPDPEPAGNNNRVDIPPPPPPPPPPPMGQGRPGPRAMPNNANAAADSSPAEKAAAAAKLAAAAANQNRDKRLAAIADIESKKSPSGGINTLPPLENQPQDLHSELMAKIAARGAESDKLSAARMAAIKELENKDRKKDENN
uniref:hypothetical protein n=1 Tax=Candidatus Ichthyocystis hellenicum TaxID=1561003 RepID=UPI003B967A1D